LDAGLVNLFGLQRLSRYRVWGPYTRVDTSVVSSTSYLDLSVSSGQTYYYVATEVDTTGTESGYSGEVSAVIP
jgi:fibronectin type 3 domain-containing protein